MRNQTINQIFKFAKSKNGFDLLEKYVNSFSKKKLENSIVECGILPEIFEHDSSEEKLWAKYSDIVLAKSMSELGIRSTVIGARGNSADVLGTTKEFTIVADAKTFRLSRTAKNQKDFKVAALDSWRGKNNYALLVAPLVQFPINKSQIYKQAIEYNVTLFSYTHLLFLIDNNIKKGIDLIWETGIKLNDILEDNEKNKAKYYWNEIDNLICHITGKSQNDLQYYKKLELQKTKKLGNEGIKYWENKIKDYNKLSKEEAIKLLIKSEKIEAKIDTIKKIINRKPDYE